MHTYIAITGQGNATTGGWFQCLQWAKQQIEDTVTVVKVFVAKPGEKEARVVGEVSLDGVRFLPGERQLAIRKLLKELPNG